ncbi:MAG TPA: class I SAM-dependent methyltransferase [Chthoniobacterales bacterium]|nr:class I SAM-dependent methyltransferase [Chthoniobacterales bacterium]
MNPQFDKTGIAAEAKALLPRFREIIAGIPPEAGFGGIWESEMFLFFATVKQFAPRQILESGRARGKSTLVLARCFPEAHIVSVELERDTANAQAAEAKLNACPNVELLYGDSRRILAERLQPGDAILIDGPKEFRSVQLAIELLRTGKPCAVFVHDFPKGSPWRRFVERHWPDTFFGDDPLFDRFRVLDEGRDPRAGTVDRSGSYGIFACFPPGLPKPYWQLRLALSVAGLSSRSS